MEKFIWMYRVKNMKDLNMIPKFTLIRLGGRWSHYKSQAGHENKLLWWKEIMS